MVIVIKDVGDLKQGDLKPVSAVKMSLELIEIFIISGKAYHYYNFRLKII
jgi:hypothetical protein